MIVACRVEIAWHCWRQTRSCSGKDVCSCGRRPNHQHYSTSNKGECLTDILLTTGRHTPGTTPQALQQSCGVAVTITCDHYIPCVPPCSNWACLLSSYSMGMALLPRRGLYIVRQARLLRTMLDQLG